MYVIFFFVICRKSSDIVFITDLNSELVKLGLNLQGLPSETVESSEPSGSKVLQIMLIILSCILGALLAALALVYFVKTRSYNRQIRALTESNFGSNSTDLNRQILPNTNVFSNEKSNPVMNNSRMSKADNTDNQSIISSDSDDFAGLYDNPIFNVRSKSDDLIEGTNVENASYI